MFVYSQQEDCEITHGELKAEGCINNYSGSYVTMMNAISSYRIKASSSITAGYSETFCVKFTINSYVSITLDSIIVTQKPVDCSKALKPGTFTIP